VDTVRITDFAEHEQDNLFKLWNRRSSGSYLPGPVRAVEIPKDHGTGVRVLGVLHVADRIAQTSSSDAAGRQARTDLPPGQLRLPAGAPNTWTRWR